MPGIGAFQAHSERYEAWFAKHEAAYLSELLAVRALLPWSGRGLEIGVGSGRFAAPLGIQVGLYRFLIGIELLWEPACRRFKGLSPASGLPQIRVWY